MNFESEAVGPLKQDKNETRSSSDSQAIDQTRPGVPSGTVADMCIYIYIYIYIHIYVCVPVHAHML